MDKLSLAVVAALVALGIVFYLPLSSWVSVAVYALLFGGAFFALTHHTAPRTTTDDDYERKKNQMFQAILENDERKLVSTLAKSLRFEGKQNLLKELTTALHYAADLGHTDCTVAMVHFLTSQNKNLSKYLDREDAASLTPLMVAVVRLHPATALALLELGARADIKGPKARNVVFLACLTAQPGLVSALRTRLGETQFSALARAGDALGYTSAHAACLGGSVDALTILLAAGAVDLAATARDGSTPLHTAARSGDGAIVKLLALHGAKLTACRFGCTPLHTACMYGRVEAVRELVHAYPLDRLVAQDNDGLHPPHTVAQALSAAAAQAASDKPADAAETIERLLECFRILIEAGYPVDCKDYSNSSLVYLLCWSADRPQLRALQILFQHLEKTGRADEIGSLLRAKADSGWTCMHAAKHMPGPASADVTALLQRLAGDYAPEMVTMELLPGRDQSNSGYLARRGAHNALPEDERRQVLRGQRTLVGVAEHLRRIVGSGRMPRVVVLCGAGISTSAGIKDFRSANGLYANKATSRVFTAEFFDTNPTEFYQHVAHEFAPMLHGAKPRPTPAHALLRVLRDAGWLSRVYTQNIDHLERDVGIQPGDLVECHGSLFRTFCPACNARSEDPATVARFWATVEQTPQQPPTCACGGVLRPDVVLFGEPLPARFHQLAYTDVAACDLLLVMGTSLVVYPVASLPSFVGPLAPRVLFNNEPSGCFQGLAPCNIRGGSVDGGDSTSAGSGGGSSGGGSGGGSGLEPITPASAPPAGPASDIGAHYRDVFFQGSCDEAARAFASTLGVTDALDAVLAE